MDWSEKNLCIKCNKGDNLLICSENGCPLAMHEGCMGCPARFDDAGNFYCPYCLYKKAVAESRRAREYALERKTALSLFMDQNKIGNETCSNENKGAEANGRHQSRAGEANVNNKEACNDGHKNNNNVEGEEENIQEDNSEASEGSSSQDPSVSLSDEQNVRNEDGKTDHEEEQDAFFASSDEDLSVEKHKHETSSASTRRDTSQTLHERGKRGFESTKSRNKDNEAVSVQSKRIKRSDNSKQKSPTVTPPRKSSRMSSCANTAEKASTERVDASRRTKQGQRSSVKIAKDIFGSGRRKRLFWTAEEEEMLKEGVRRYSVGGNKNFPWRKVLEFGRDVFHETRTPTDLFYKWRNMSIK